MLFQYNLNPNFTFVFLPPHTMLASLVIIHTVYGRPYNIDDKFKDLKADFERIDCDQYEFYTKDDENWLKFVDDNKDSGKNVSINVINDWIDKALSKHASIATYAKFSLDLMSLGAPLWFLEMANNASLDEIEHTKFSFDILNMYLINYYNQNGCIRYKEFPSHTVNIDGDYDRIASDTAIDGCFGELVSALTFMNGQEEMNGYLRTMALDELNHTSFAWVTIRWIIEQNGAIQVANKNWWEQQILKNGNIESLTDIERHIYINVIPSIIDMIWNENGELRKIDDYPKLYQSIVTGLVHQFNVIYTVDYCQDAAGCQI